MTDFYSAFKCIQLCLGNIFFCMCYRYVWYFLSFQFGYVCLRFWFFFFHCFTKKKYILFQLKADCWLLWHTSPIISMGHCNCVWTLVPYSLISIKAVSIGTNYCSILTTECGGYLRGLTTDNLSVGITGKFGLNHTSRDGRMIWKSMKPPKIM